MTVREMLDLFGPVPLAFAVAYAAGATMLVLVRLRPRIWNRRIVRAMDRILQRESESMRGLGDPLNFRPSEYVGGNAGGLRWWYFPERIEVMRTVRAALVDGYRIKLRARARGSRGRIIDRTIEFDVRHMA